MNKLFYLLNIGVSGVKSIKEEVRLDFYKKTVDKDFNPDRYRVKAIYGENGSGKSALITAIKIFRDLIVNENYLAETKNQNYLDEIINKQTKTFKFDCEYLVDIEEKIVYYYAVEIGKNTGDRYEIQHEVLKLKSGNYSNKNYKVIFESKNGELEKLHCDGDEKKMIEKKTANLLAMNPFAYLYIVKYFNIEKKLQHNLLAHVLLFLTLTASIKIYIVEEDQHELYFLQKSMKESSLDDNLLMERWREFSQSQTVLFNTNEKTISKDYFEKYKGKIQQLTQFIKIFKSNLVAIDIDAKENGENYECELNLNYGEYSINKEFESTGIKKLIRLFDCFSVASNGGIVFIDEMDSNLNDVYLCKLIEYFMYYGTGQLCFTTHNLDPMSVLKENKNSIDFLSNDNHLVSWSSRGNASPENCFKNGMIEDIPFNVDATDFVGMFGE